jgi:hypothetical protein
MLSEITQNTGSATPIHDSCDDYVNGRYGFTFPGYSLTSRPLPIDLCLP